MNPVYIHKDGKKIPYEEYQREMQNKHNAWLQKERYEGTNIICNSNLTNNMIEQYCELGTKQKSIIEKAFDKYDMSARMYYKILKIARTLADMEGNEKISCENILESINYRILDKKYW